MKKGQHIQKAIYAGTLKIGDIEIPCAVLEDGTRVLSQRGFARAIGGSTPSSRGDGNLPTFLTANNIKPFIDKDLMVTAKPNCKADLESLESLAKMRVRCPKCRLKYTISVANKIKRLLPES